MKTTFWILFTVFIMIYSAEPNIKFKPFSILLRVASLLLSLASDINHLKDIKDIVARIARIVITIISSTRVKPFIFLLDMLQCNISTFLYNGKFCVCTLIKFFINKKALKNKILMPRNSGK